MARRTPQPALTPEQEAESDRIFAAPRRAAAGDLRALADLLATEGDSNTFGAAEYAVRGTALRIGAEALGSAPGGAQRGGYRGPSGACPHCHEAAELERWRAEPVAATTGRVRVERAYYRCEHCHAGRGPRDAALGLATGDLSRGATEAAALAGAPGGFAEAATKTLPKWGGVRVSESTVERAAERAGEDVGKREGGDVARRELKGVDASGRSGVAREARRVLRVYFADPAHRMGCPSCRAKGWLIGSGPVEAACEQVVGRRMEGSGMRRGEAGADAACHLRALSRSEKTQWDGYWTSLAA